MKDALLAFAGLLTSFALVFCSPHSSFAVEPSAQDCAAAYVYDGASSDEASEAVRLADMAAPSTFRRNGGEVGIQVQEFSGDTRYDTASMQALAAYPSSEYVIVAGNGAWPDALAATGLAGVLDCPVLLTEREQLTPRTAETIKRLGAKRAVLLGGDLRVTDAVRRGLESLGLRVDRLAGETRQDTQMMVYDYGKSAPNGASWSGDMVAFASGYRFHDALSFSPVAFSRRVPVFLLDESGDLAAGQRAALSGRRFSSSVVLGGRLASSDSTVAFAGSVSGSGRADRIAGETRFDTSAQLAAWAVSRGYLSWDGAAFATDALPYDALAGGVLQGKSRSVVLMVDGASGSGPAVSAAAAHRGSISSIRFFGGELSISANARRNIISELTNVRYSSYGATLNGLIEAQRAVLNGIGSWSEDFRNKQLSALPAAVNPAAFSYGQPSFYQFANLNDGYAGQSADLLNSFINTNGSTGKLAGMGQAFIDASRRTGVNETYLLAHAILESGWGKSMLASGFEYNGSDLVDGKRYPKGTYYNFYGIGAVDSGPLSGGRALAVKMGWDSPYKAIVGAADWIRDNYVGRGQNTLYEMRWNPAGFVSHGYATHQYATDVHWASNIARVMDDCYRYAGKDMNDSDLSFDVPSYR